MRSDYFLKKLLLFSSISLFSFVSKIIFDKVYIASHNVIDEAFHLPQGLQYCNLNFSTWDPKITTLPGLYLISTAFLAPLNYCSIYGLRFVNLVASVVNLLLFYLIYGLNDVRVSVFKKLVLSLNLAFLPPLYFFSHLYYTDVLSLTFILLLVLFNQKEKHVISSICGMSAVLIRQTNIIWVLFVFGRYVLKEVFHVLKHSKNNTIRIKDLKELLLQPSQITCLKGIALEVWLNFLAYLSVILSFTFFVFINGSIVVGDKTAHNASIHLPQLLYFSLFCFIFTWPTYVQHIAPFFSFIQQRKIFTAASLAILIAIVYLNTEVHPYLLADNRHYTFYIWNRFYEKFFWFRYTAIVVYFYSFYCIFAKIYVKDDVSFILLYVPCLILVLSFQRMIEIRYFFIPYVLFKLNVTNHSFKLLFTELLYFCLINALTLKLFFVKNIYWKDFDYPQKLIW